MIYLDNIEHYWCQACNKTIKPVEVNNKPLAWYSALCLDESLWFKKAFNEFPSIIAHEYWRLYELLRKGQTYGVLLQLKDLFEVLLKFPVLVLVSEMYNRPGRSDKENKVLGLLLSKNLSLGDWESIARMLLRDSRANESWNIIRCILEQILKVYQDTNITNWRNNEIGHGALTFDTDLNFQADIKSKLLMLQTYLSNNAEQYSSITFCMRMNKELLVLRGKDTARNISYSGDLWLVYKQSEIPLYPFILHHQEGIYFFDTYQKLKNRTYVLNYPEGKKCSLQNNANEIFKKLSNLIPLATIKGRNIEDHIQSQMELNVLEKLYEVDDYETPKHLSEWLNTCLQKNKGIFLLQMEAGTGKSTFARSLDEFSLNKLKTNNLSIATRGYYINDYLSYQVPYFVQHMIDLLRQTKRNQPSNIIGIKGINESSRNPDKEFARALNEYREAYEKLNKCKRLMIILDGLEEIPASNEKTIFDFIPNSDDLDDGIYILLTCRTNEEIIDKPFTLAKLSDLTIDDNKVYYRNSSENKSVMDAYVRKHILGIRDQIAFDSNISNQIEFLLNKADNRFLYLKTLKELLQGDNKTNLDSAISGSDLLFLYLESLEKNYGEIYMSKVVRILTILAIAYEPLTLNEIAFLLGDGIPSTRLIAHMIDLRGFLVKERNYRSNALFSLAHDEWRQSLISNFEPIVDEILSEWAQIIKSLCGNYFPWTNADYDGETYLLAYIVNYIQEWGKRDSVKDFALRTDWLANVAATIANISKIDYQLYRAILMCSGIIEILNNLNNTGIIYDQNHLAVMYANRATAHIKKREYHHALKDTNQGMEVLKLLFKQNGLPNWDVLNDIILRRGSCYLELGDYDKAIEDLGQAISWIHEGEKRGVPVIPYRLLNALINRGLAYTKINEFEQAIMDFDEAIVLFNTYQDEIEMSTDYNLADILNYRGAVYRKQGEYPKALEDYDKAIELSGKELHTTDLALIQVNRGLIYWDINENDKALKDLEQAIPVIRNALQQGELGQIIHLADALNCRANVQVYLQKNEEALKDYNEAVKLYRYLSQSRAKPLMHKLSMILINRAETNRLFEKYPQAEADLTEAIDILRKMPKALKQQGMFRALMHRGNVFRDTTRYRQALDDYNRALSIWEKLTVNSPNLATILMNRGATFYCMQDLEEAFTDYNAVVQIRRELYKQSKLPNEYELAAALANRGRIYFDMHNLSEAIKDFDEYVAITTKMVENGYSMDPVDNATVLYFRGLTANITDKPDKAIADFKLVAELFNVAYQNLIVNEQQYNWWLWNNTINEGAAHIMLGNQDDFIECFKRLSLLITETQNKNLPRVTEEYCKYISITISALNEREWNNCIQEILYIIGDTLNGMELSDEALLCLSEAFQLLGY